MLCLDYFFALLFGVCFEPRSELSPGSNPWRCSTVTLWRASYGWNFYSISFSCNCQPILKYFRSCCMASDLILNIKVYAVKCCVTFLTGQGSLHPYFRAFEFRWLLSTGLMKYLPRPWVMGRVADGSVVSRSCAGFLDTFKVLHSRPAG